MMMMMMMLMMMMMMMMMMVNDDDELLSPYVQALLGQHLFVYVPCNIGCMDLSDLHNTNDFCVAISHGASGYDGSHGFAIVQINQSMHQSINQSINHMRACLCVHNHVCVCVCVCVRMA